MILVCQHRGWGGRCGVRKFALQLFSYQVKRAVKMLASNENVICCCDNCNFSLAWFHCLLYSVNGIHITTHQLSLPPLSLPLSLSLSFACISFKWLRIFLISAFSHFFFWAPPQWERETITSSINFSLCSRLYWLESLPEPGGTVRPFGYILHSIASGSWDDQLVLWLHSARLVSSRLLAERCDAAQLSRLDSTRLCLFVYCLSLSSFFLLLSLSLGEFSFTSLFISLHFVNQFAWEAFVYCQRS